jgi:hypothetical protein
MKGPCGFRVGKRKSLPKSNNHEEREASLVMGNWDLLSLLTMKTIWCLPYIVRSKTFIIITHRIPLQPSSKAVLVCRTRIHHHKLRMQ